MNAFPKIRHSGFSLVELMIGLAVMGILMSVALPNYKVWLMNTQVRNATDSILNGMQHARAEAVKRNADIEFVLSAQAVDDETSWMVRIPGALLPPYIDSRVSSEGSKKVRRVVLPLGADRITFNGTGTPYLINPANGSARITQVTLQSSVLTVAESRDLRVTVGVGGNIRMCDPNLSPPNPRAC